MYVYLFILSFNQATSEPNAMKVS